MTSSPRLDTFGDLETLADRIAGAFRVTRPESEGPEFRQWSDDVVAVALILAAALAAGWLAG